ncbi:winged helix-turn-helix transcriptional regulator [Streptomyces sp. NPDC012888]|uniref:winged helix-turn-helix transcriptional regulator n=1 Tax=Streptomyces sp. NPDC012888 TaxID=3364855 RepID=UPI00368DC688
MATMTAAARRAEARSAYDAFLRDCPTSLLMARIGDKWVGLVVGVLRDSGGTGLRYSDLGRAIPGVSQKMLTQTLRSLERDGLVSRTVTPSVPARVDYALTPLGEGLGDLLAAVKDWADGHFGEIHAAREAYDRDRAAEEGTAVSGAA